MRRFKVRKYLRNKWDISFRRTFVGKSEDEQIEELGEIGRFMHELAWTPVPLHLDDQSREYFTTGILKQIEKAINNETT